MMDERYAQILKRWERIAGRFQNTAYRVMNTCERAEKLNFSNPTLLTSLENYCTSEEFLLSNQETQLTILEDLLKAQGV